MRIVFLFAFLISCSQLEPRSIAPSWVSAIRNGEESLKINHGGKLFFRRIAGGPELGQQTSCELAVLKAQEDMHKEFRRSVPHTVEVLYYDFYYGDCAVTISVDRRRELASIKPEKKSEDEYTDEDVSDLLVERSDRAIKFALTGLTKHEFEKFSRENVVVNEGEGLCRTFFQTDYYSIHGLTQVCWTNEHVQGYCTTRTNQCWMRTPQ